MKIVVGRTVAAGRRDDALDAGSASDLLRALTTHTPVGVFVSDPDGACIYVNERWCELTGLRFADALGDGWSAALHPDDRKRVAAEWAAASAEGRDSVVEYRFLRPDGTIVWVKGYASAAYGAAGLLGWVGSLLEITEYRNAARALTQERETFRAAFDDAPTGMALVAPAGRFLRVNSAFCQIVGYKQADLLELSFQDITDPRDLDADVELIGQLLAGRIASYRLEKRYLRPNRDLHWAAISVSLIRGDQGEPLHFVVHVEDIHERKLAQDQLREHADHDSLTGLLNRRRLIEELDTRSRQNRQRADSADLILIDLDRFKNVNDSLGHAAGDRVLIAAGRALQARLQETDILARLGGDEFAVIAPTDDDPGRGDQVAADLLAAISSSEADGHAPHIALTASAGIATIINGANPADILEAADQALYQAKQSGRNRAARAQAQAREPRRKPKKPGMPD